MDRRIGCRWLVGYWLAVSVFLATPADAQQRSWTWLDEGTEGRYDLFAQFASLPPSYGLLDDGTVVATQMIKGSPAPGFQRMVGWRPDGSPGLDVFSDCCVLLDVQGAEMLFVGGRSGTAIGVDSGGSRLWRSSYEPIWYPAHGALGSSLTVLAGSDPGEDGVREVAVAVALDRDGSEVWRKNLSDGDVGAHESTNWRYVTAADNDEYCLGGSVRRSIYVYDAVLTCIGADGHTRWLDVYSAEPDSTDIVYAVESVSGGGLAVLGTSRPRWVGDAAAWLRRYDANGSLLWSTQLDDVFVLNPELSVRAESLTVSWSGQSRSGVIELDSDGSVLWRHEGPSSGGLAFAHPASHSRDASGDTYSAVTLEVDGKRCVGFRRLDSSGDEVLVRQHCLANEHAQPSFVRALPTGDVGVVVWLTPIEDEDPREIGYLVFSADGAIVSESRSPERLAAGGCSKLPDRRCLGVDESGNTYLTSWTGGVPGRAYMESLDPAGTPRWRLDPAPETPFTIPAPVSSVNGGRVALAFGVGPEAERVWTLDESGDVLYSANAEYPRALVLRGDGGLYLVNSSSSVTHLGASGEIEWQAPIGSSVAELAPGDHLALGVTDGAAMVSDTGDVLWTTLEPTTNWRYPQDIDVSADSMVAVALAPIRDSRSIDVLVVSAEGDVAWSRSLSSESLLGLASRPPGSIATTVSFGPTGRLAVAGQLATSAGHYGVVALLSVSGELVWLATTDREGVVSDTETDSNSVWVAGRFVDGLDDDGFVQRYDIETGDLLFSDVFEGLEGSDDRFYDLELDPFGNALVAGDSNNQHGLPRRLLVKYSVSGDGLFEAEKSVSGHAVPGGVLTYRLTLRNAGAVDQLDNPGPEMVDELPEGLELLSAQADTGVASIDAGTRTVTWDGSLAPGGSTTIEILARVSADVVVGTSLINQAAISYDSNGDGFNDGSGLSSDEAGGPGSSTISVVVTPIPALGPWGLALLALMIGLAGVGVRRLG